jgi:hypothetical protein
MFEKSFLRPKNYFQLSLRQQWEIDKELGILDWSGEHLTKKEWDRFLAHYSDKQTVIVEQEDGLE